MNYKKHKTTYEVWKSIKQAHPELRVFSSYSAPESGLMETSYGFKGDDYPVMEARTTWDINVWGEVDMNDQYIRNNEKHEYWLCVAVYDDGE
jgi:hypothetical protein